MVVYVRVFAGSAINWWKWTQKQEVKAASHPGSTMELVVGSELSGRKAIRSLDFE